MATTVRKAEKLRARAARKAAKGPDGLPVCTCRTVSCWDADCPRCWLTDAQKALMLDGR